MNKLPLLLLGILLGACGVLRAQSFDLTTGRVPLASLDGLWRFHTGDSPDWADPNFDDSKWPLLRSDRTWDSQGYKGYSGLAWYRFQVTVPDGLNDVSLYLPHINTAYEAYADGKLIGTYGKMPPNSGPYVGGGSFQVYSLPDRKHGKEMIQVALRVWQWPGWVKYNPGGPERGGGLVGETKEIENRNDRDRDHSLRSGSDYEILGLLEALAGLGALTLFALRRKEPEYLWFSAMTLFTAAAYWIFVSLIAQTWNVELFDFIYGAVYACGSLASIGFYQQLLQPRRTWLLTLALASVALALLDQVTASLSGSFQGVWLQSLIVHLCYLILQAWIVAAVISRARQKSLDARLLVAPVVLSTFVGLLGGAEGVSNILGWQQRWRGDLTLTRRPFPIGFADVTEALFLLAVSGILILRFTRTRSQEERFESEVRAAREVQQYLIPVHLPLTPGFTIESEYRPAREVGGDFFQVLPNAEDGSVLLVLGDVAGKGLHAGMLATLIVGAIRTAAKFTTDPERVLELLNERVQGRGLVTCQALLIERDGNVTLANAGHLPPYLNQREMPMEGALPLGAIPGMEFSVVRFQLAEGDSLMLMSDGVAEAQDVRGNLFGFERIGAMLTDGATAAGLAIAAQNFGQEDDITVLTVARAMPKVGSLPCIAPG